MARRHRVVPEVMPGYWERLGYDIDTDRPFQWAGDEPA
jgi:hypothetical protein